MTKKKKTKVRKGNNENRIKKKNEQEIKLTIFSNKNAYYYVKCINYLS